MPMNLVFGFDDRRYRGQNGAADVDIDPGDRPNEMPDDRRVGQPAGPSG